MWKPQFAWPLQGGRRTICVLNNLFISKLPPVRQRAQFTIYPHLDTENPELFHAAAPPLFQVAHLNMSLVHCRLNLFGRLCCWFLYFWFPRFCLLCRGFLSSLVFFGLFLFHLFITELPLREHSTMTVNAHMQVLDVELNANVWETLPCVGISSLHKSTHGTLFL